MIGELYEHALAGWIRPVVERADGSRMPLPVDGWLHESPADQSILSHRQSTDDREAPVDDGARRDRRTARADRPGENIPSVNPGGVLRGRFRADRSGTHTIVTVLTVS